MTKEEKKARDREYYAKNRDAIKKRAHERYANRTAEQIAARALYDIQYAQRKVYLAAKRRKENPVRHLELVKKWRENADPDAWRRKKRNARRTRRARVRAGGKLSVDIDQRLMELQKGKCPVCRSSIKDDFHLDHIVPLAAGGRNEDDNVQLLCPKCNQTKSDKDPVEFMQSRGFLL